MEEQLLIKTKRIMGRTILRTSLHDQIVSQVIWERNEVKDVIVEYQKQKFHWAEHITKFTDNRCSCQVVAEILKMATQKKSTMMERLNWWFEPNIKKNGEIKKEMEMDCG